VAQELELILGAEMQRKKVVIYCICLRDEHPVWINNTFSNYRGTDCILFKKHLTGKGCKRQFELCRVTQGVAE